MYRDLQKTQPKIVTSVQDIFLLTHRDGLLQAGRGLGIRRLQGRRVVCHPSARTVLDSTEGSDACAIALSPAILLLDEAFEGLAPIVVNRYAEVVK